MAIDSIPCADIPSYPVTIIGPNMVGRGGKFQNKGSQKAEKR